MCRVLPSTTVCHGDDFGRFTSEELREDASRWQDFGFFFQNCREYLGNLDIGVPARVLTKARVLALSHRQSP